MRWTPGPARPPDLVRALLSARSRDRPGAREAVHAAAPRRHRGARRRGRRCHWSAAAESPRSRRRTCSPGPRRRWTTPRACTSPSTPPRSPTRRPACSGGDGDLLRPASFQGTLQVLVAGSRVEVEVVSVDGTVYAQLPFTAGFSVVEPADFGIGDPAALLDPESGISQLLEAVEDPRLGEERRVGGEVVREVTGRIPGDLVEQLLTSQDPEQPVDATFAITVEGAELRRAELTGPFFTAEDDATYVVESQRLRGRCRDQRAAHGLSRPRASRPASPGCRSSPSRPWPSSSPRPTPTSSSWRCPTS